MSKPCHNLSNAKINRFLMTCLWESGYFYIIRSVMWFFLLVCLCAGLVWEVLSKPWCEPEQPLLPTHVCRGGLCVLERINAVFKWTHYHQREHKHSSRKTSVPEPRRCLSLAFRGTEAEQQTTKKDRQTSSWISHSAQSPQQTSALFPFFE